MDDSNTPYRSEDSTNETLQADINMDSGFDSTELDRIRMGVSSPSWSASSPNISSSMPTSSLSESGTAPISGASSYDLSRHIKGIESVPEAIAVAVDQAIRSFQPHFHEAINELTERAMQISHQAAKQVTTKIRRNPWLFAGGCALLVFGFSVVFRVEDRRRQRASKSFLH